MNIVEFALEQVDKEDLPVSRGINVGEMQTIRAIAKKRAENTPGGAIIGNVMWSLIDEAYKYGFWQGFRHCEVERLEYDDYEDDADLT